MRSSPGFPAVTGLYTTIACLVGYAVFGPSRVLVLGPGFVDLAVDPGRHHAAARHAEIQATAIALAGMLAVLVGLTEIGLGLGKLGFVADLLSKEVQVGYMNGLAITIIIGQLPKLFGFSTHADSFLAELRAFFEGLDQTHGTTLVVGVAVLAVLLVLPRITTRLPAVLVAVVGATVVSAVLRTGRPRRVPPSAPCPRGSRHPRFPWTSASDVVPLFFAAVGHHARVADRHDRHGDQLCGAARRRGRARTRRWSAWAPRTSPRGSSRASPCRPAARGQPSPSSRGPRASSPVSSGAALVAVLLLFLNSLLADLPQTALAAVVIVAALSLMDVGDPAPLLRVRKSAFGVSLVATAGVMLLGVLQGIVVAVALAILLFFRRNWWPHGAVLGGVEQIEGWHDIDAIRMPSSSRASSCTAGRRHCSSPTPARFASRSGKSCVSATPDWIVLQCEAVTDVDVTAAEMLEQLDNELNAAGIHLAFAEMRGRLQDLTLRYGLLETLDREHFYPTLEAALEEIHASDSSRVARGKRNMARDARAVPVRSHRPSSAADAHRYGRRGGRTVASVTVAAAGRAVLRHVLACSEGSARAPLGACSSSRSLTSSSARRCCLVTLGKRGSSSISV